MWSLGSRVSEAVAESTESLNADAAGMMQTCLPADCSHKFMHTLMGM